MRIILWTVTAAVLFVVGSSSVAEAGVVKAIVSKRRETHEGLMEKHRHKAVMRKCDNC